MPQTLTSWWKEHLGEDWAVTYDLLRHSLGNITLTAYNSELSNDEFLTKRTHFQNSHLELNRYFHDKESWRRENVEARAEYLADRALQIWNYFGNELIESQPSIKLSGSAPKLLFILLQEYAVQTWRDVLETTLNRLLARIG